MSKNNRVNMVWIDGKVVAESDAGISLLSTGLTVGMGFFETMSFENERFFKFDLHYARLEAGLKIIQAKPPSIDYLRDGAKELIKINNYYEKSCRVRISCYEDHGRILTVIAIFKIPKYDAKARIVLSPHKVNQSSILSGYKSTSYATNLIALRQANEDGADEAILLNTAGDLCEGATSNIFIVMDGQIQTPELASGCLPGVMRQVVLEMCEKLRLPHIEKNLKLEDLLNCEEAFITSSLRKIQRVGWFGNKKMGRKADGLVDQLQLAFKTRLD